MWQLCTGCRHNTLCFRVYEDDLSLTTLYRSEMLNDLGKHDSKVELTIEEYEYVSTISTWLFVLSKVEVFTLNNPV